MLAAAPEAIAGEVRPSSVRVTRSALFTAPPALPTTASSAMERIIGTPLGDNAGACTGGGVHVVGALLGVASLSVRTYVLANGASSVTSHAAVRSR